MNDEIVEPIRQIREELIKRHGGIDGYFKHCQAQDRARAARAKRRRRTLRARSTNAAKGRASEPVKETGCGSDQER